MHPNIVPHCHLKAAVVTNHWCSRLVGCNLSDLSHPLGPIGHCYRTTWSSPLGDASTPAYLQFPCSIVCCCFDDPFSFFWGLIFLWLSPVLLFSSCQSHLSDLLCQLVLLKYKIPNGITCSCILWLNCHHWHCFAFHSVFLWLSVLLFSSLTYDSDNDTCS